MLYIYIYMCYIYNQYINISNNLKNSNSMMIMYLLLYMC